MDKALKIVEEILRSSVFWGIVGLVLSAIAISRKFSMSGADNVLVIAWAIALVGIYRGDPVAGFNLVPRILTTTLAVSALGLCFYALSNWFHKSQDIPKVENASGPSTPSMNHLKTPHKSHSNPDQQLVNDTLALAGKIRGLWQDWKVKYDANLQNMGVELDKATTEEQKQKIRNDYRLNLYPINSDAVFAYGNRYQADAVRLRQQLNEKQPVGTRDVMAGAAFVDPVSPMELDRIATDLEVSAKLVQGEIDKRKAPK